MLRLRYGPWKSARHFIADCYALTVYRAVRQGHTKKSLSAGIAMRIRRRMLDADFVPSIGVVDERRKTGGRVRLLRPAGYVGGPSDTAHG